MNEILVLQRKLDLQYLCKRFICVFTWYCQAYKYMG